MTYRNLGRNGQLGNQLWQMSSRFGQRHGVRQLRV